MATERNVRARLSHTRSLPGTFPLKCEVTIWWLGDRFHVRDTSGRSASQVLGDAAAPEGMGRQPRTKEEFMDTYAEPDGAVDIFGARSTEYGLIVETPGSDKYEVETKTLLPAAERLFTADLAGITAGARGKLLGRDTIEYVSFLGGERGGFHHRVRRVVAGPYVLLHEVTDELGGTGKARTEVVALDEGVVQPADVQPGSPA
ncbi:hypothetical protein [Phytomonospora endophytica]|uniref:Uncharacterized protein n=1 Tax=Phytomonospora endophytica TaxID=714109 RepID=A0A841FSQ0_9ACTN|nr:hypothetical protein [Phytomonospora endophytica]MBB6037833.1 hypothetical protein [Phytomonospora endophytica]GIG68732.1 hypothetical protein Pen01_50270 [Phytomonospora endophytica]